MIRISKLTNDRSGIALIVAIFAMLLLAVLGWTLTVMLSGDFEVSLRNLDSERALSLAESGGQWVVNRLGTNPMEARPWSVLHNLEYGQYEVVCQDGTGTEAGKVVITSTGYVPSKSDYRAMRQVKLTYTLNIFEDALKTQTPDAGIADRGLFKWADARAGHTVGIEGNISAGHYDGDGDAVYDEQGEDFDPPPAPLLPENIDSSTPNNRDFTVVYPSIDMQWFYNNASNRWPDPSTQQIVATLTYVGIISGKPTIEVGQDNFFTGMKDEAVVLNVAAWYNNDNNWRYITKIPGAQNGRRAELNQAVSWQAGDIIKLVKRFDSSVNNKGIFYIGGQIAGGSNTDILIDLNNNIDINNTYLICEGNIVIKKANSLTFKYTGNETRFPAFATKNGDIVSTEDLQAALPSLSEAQRQERRAISGLIYSEFGSVKLNYLRPSSTASPSFRGNMVYGYKVTLDGRITIIYLPGLVSNFGFTSQSSLGAWKEQ